jgi:chemotaxis protein MotD
MVEAVTAAANEIVATNFTIAKTLATTPAAAVKSPTEIETPVETNPQLASVVASTTSDPALTAIKLATTAHRSDAAKPAAELVSGDAAAATPQAPQPGNAATNASPTLTSPAGGAAANPIVDDSAAGDAATPAVGPAGHHPSAAHAQPQALQPDPGSQIASTMPQPQTLPPTNTAIPAAQLTATVATNPAVPISGLAIQIATSAQGGRSRFEIRLDPAELGRIDVRLDVDRHGQVTSHLTVEKPETLAMLRQDAPQLQRALEDAGLKTGNNGLQFSLRDQSSSGNHHGNGHDADRQPHRLIISDVNTVAAVAAGRTYLHAAGASRGVDIRV